MNIIPVLKEYNIKDESKKASFSLKSEFVIDENVASKDRVLEIVELVKEELELFGQNSDHAHTVSIKIDASMSNKEAYEIEIDEEISIVAASHRALLYALRTLIKLMNKYGAISYGKIVDSPDVLERRLHVDTGRKYFSKDWLVKLIKRLSYLNMNTLQLHFSENKGYRIDSKFAPEIVSNNYLTFEEVEEILSVAKEYEVEIIPSFDTPGHTEHILKSHPEFGVLDIHGEYSKVALDITNKEAVEFVYGLMDEILEIFSECTQVHLGADEFMEFDREPFTTDVMPLMQAHAEKTLGKEYNWKDLFANYINDLAEHVYNKGFKPRIWNDGIYYGEEDLPTAGGAPQNVEMHDYIGVDFWSSMQWNPSVATLDILIDRGVKELYNVHAGYFYYVLRMDQPEDGRNMHSFDHLYADRRIYVEWTPGQFAEYTLPNDSPLVKGASMAIWNDNPDIATEDVIWEDIKNELSAFASKTWNLNSSEIVRFRHFKKESEENLKTYPFTQ